MYSEIFLYIWGQFSGLSSVNNLLGRTQILGKKSYKYMYMRGSLSPNGHLSNKDSIVWQECPY